MAHSARWIKKHGFTNGLWRLNERDKTRAAMTQLIAKLTPQGVHRVLDGAAGMTFVVDSITTAADGRRIAHVRDYRFPNSPDDGTGFQIWSIGPDGYQLVTP